MLVLEQPFVVRRFQPEDLKSVMEINLRALPENYTASFFLDIHRGSPDSFLIAEIDRNTVGYIMCRIEFGFSDLRRFRMIRKGHVVSVAVLPEYRHRGIGTALISTGLQAMQVKGVEECFLEVRTTNEAAIQLYKDLGFTVIRVAAGYYHDGADACVMSRSLKEEPSVQ